MDGTPVVFWWFDAGAIRFGDGLGDGFVAVAHVSSWLNVVVGPEPLENRFDCGAGRLN